MSELKSIEYYADLAADLVDNPSNKEKRDLWSKVDKLMNFDLHIPDSVKEKEWIGNDAKFAHSLPHDILVGTKTFLATRLPLIHIMPMRYDALVHSKMEFAETILDWHYAQLNERGDIPIQLELTDDAVRYLACAFQVEDMRFEGKLEKDKKAVYTAEEVKEMRRFGDFRWIRHHPLNVYPVRANDVLKKVLRVGVYSLFALQEEYGENDAIARAIAKEFPKEKPKQSDLRSRFVSLFDLTDEDNRIIWFTCNGEEKELQTDAEKKYVIVKEKRKLKFIPWVIQDFGSPMMEGVVKSGVWEHLGTMDLIQYCDWLDKADQPSNVLKTPNVNNPNFRIEQDGPSGTAITDTQSDYQRLPKHPIDQQWMILRNALENQLRASAKAEAIVNLASASNANQVGAMNMLQATAIAQLNLEISFIQRAIASGLLLMCKYVHETKEPLLGYRREAKDSSELGRVGAQFFMESSDNFREDAPMETVYVHPDFVNIKVELQPTTIQDRQALANQAIVEQQAGMSQEKSLEKLSPNPSIERDRKIQEGYEMNFVKIDMMLDEAKAQAQVIIENAKNTAKMIMQQAAQAQAQTEGQQEGSPPSTETAQRQRNAGAQFDATKGMDDRAGGMNPPNRMVPGENQQTISGQTRTGQELT